MSFIGLFFGARRILAVIFQWVTQNPIRIAIVALLAVAGYLAIANISLRGDIAQRDKIVALRDREISGMITASDKARIAQVALNQAMTDKQTQIERLNRETSKLQSFAIRDASSRYAANNSLRKACPNIASAANPAAKDSIAQGNDGLQGDAVMVSAADFDLLNNRTADAMKYEDWARMMVAEGLAVEAK